MIYTTMVDKDLIYSHSIRFTMFAFHSGLFVSKVRSKGGKSKVILLSSEWDMAKSTLRQCL